MMTVKCYNLYKYDFNKNVFVKMPTSIYYELKRDSLYAIKIKGKNVYVDIPKCLNGTTLTQNNISYLILGRNTALNEKESFELETIEF